MTAMTAAERKRKSRAALREAGASASIELGPAGTKDLARILQHLRQREAGCTAKGAVEFALRQVAGTLATVRSTATLLRKPK